MCGTLFSLVGLDCFICGVKPLRCPPPPTQGPGADFLLKAGMDLIFSFLHKKERSLLCLSELYSFRVATPNKKIFEPQSVHTHGGAQKRNNWEYGMRTYNQSVGSRGRLESVVSDFLAEINESRSFANPNITIRPLERFGPQGSDHGGLLRPIERTAVNHHDYCVSNVWAPA
jgi:hypothetical protein